LTHVAAPGRGLLQFRGGLYQLGRLADGVINRQPLSLRSPHGEDIRAARPPARFAHQADGPPGSAFRDDVRPHPSELQVAGGFQPHGFLSRASVMVSQVSRRSRPAHLRLGLEPAASVALRIEARKFRSKESPIPTNPHARAANPPRTSLIATTAPGRKPAAPRTLAAKVLVSAGWSGLSLSRQRRSSARDRRAVKRAARAVGSPASVSNPGLDGPEARATITPIS
jgi:hypothetical protein